MTGKIKVNYKAYKIMGRKSKPGAARKVYSLKISEDMFNNLKRII